MSTVGRSTGPTAPAATNTTAAASTEAFDVADYLKNGDEVMSAKYLLGITSKSHPNDPPKETAYTKAFDKNLKAAIDKLGPNPTAAQVKTEANKELFKQRILKSAMDSISNKIMDRIKEANSDSFEV
jgi:hypothetical protein